MRKLLLAVVATALTQSSIGFAQGFNLYDPRATVAPIEPGAPTRSTHLPDHSPMLPEAVAMDYRDAGGECFWASAEYLYWWTKNSPVPTPLVTLGDAADLVPGALGQPGTRVLYGGSNESLGGFSGGRFTAGWWITRSRVFGFEASAFFLERRTQIFNASSDATGAPDLATPFFDVINNVESSYLASSPGLAAGFTSVHNTSRLWGFETNFVMNACQSGNVKATLLAGYRNLQLSEELNAFQVFTPLIGGGLFNVGFSPANPGDVISSYDRFRTRNQFNGSQVGARLDWADGWFTASLAGKVALGATHQIVNIDGGSLLIAPSSAQSFVPGGIFALPSNMGAYSRDVFAVVPEVSVNVGVQITSQIKGFVGYNFLYISSVARPGNQIDRAVNVNKVPTDFAFGTPGGPARPAFRFDGSDYWAHGVNVGLEFRY